jgi:hypothetical protein
MRTFGFLWFAILFTLFATTGCKRERIVYASSEGGADVYQPRQLATHDESEARLAAQNEHQLTGELIKVDVLNNLVTVRTESGMEQTFKLDSTTTVNGTANSFRKNRPTANSQILAKNLVGKEGQIVVVDFEDPSGPRLATSIDVK